MILAFRHVIPHLFSLNPTPFSFFPQQGPREGPHSINEINSTAQHHELDALLHSLSGRVRPISPSPQLIVSCDEEGSENLVLKIQAVGEFFQRHLCSVGKVCFVFLLLPTASPLLPPTSFHSKNSLRANELSGKISGLYATPTYAPCLLLRPHPPPSTAFMSGLFSIS